MGTKKMKKIVLMYHDVYKGSETESGFQFSTSFPYKISADIFESHVRFAHDYCYQNQLPLDTIEFTFDDGGESFYRVIAPILEKYGYRGVFFVSTSYIDTEKFLTTEQIKELHQRGHIIASHSHSHPRNMTELSESELLNEWRRSVQILEKIIQSPVVVASIPSGYNSKEVTDSAAQAGIKILYTSKPTDKLAHATNISLIGRYVIHCNTSTDKLSKIIYSANYRRKMLCRWALINCVKRLLGKHYNSIKKNFFR